MKIDHFTLRVQYTTNEGKGGSKTWTLDLVNVAAFGCDVSELGVKAGQKLQEALDAHSEGAVELRGELERFKAQSAIAKASVAQKEDIAQSVQLVDPPQPRRRGRPPKKKLDN